MKTPTSQTQPETITCPACGLLCDDLEMDAQHPTTLKNACPKGTAFFTQAIAASNAVSNSPRINGKPTDLDNTIKAAAHVLQNKQQPLFAGLGTEVQGARALLSLAKKIGATLDHMHGEAFMRNTLALQNSGWQTTTLTEIKNRADLIVSIGTDITNSHPRFLEKLVHNNDSLFSTAGAHKIPPEVIMLGNPAKPDQLPDIINALNALALNKKPHADQIRGMTIASLQDILTKIKAANYTVLLWSANHLDFPHAELTIQSITRLIAKLNETTRVAGLPLSTGNGDTTMSNVSTWLTGYPNRSRFVDGKPVYDPYYFSVTQQMQDCDALLWISTFNAIAPPKQAGIPTIVIGHPGTQFETEPDIFIPVGIPAVHHTGTLFRMDSAVALPLKKIVDNALPTLAQVARQIAELLP